VAADAALTADGGAADGPRRYSWTSSISVP